MRTAHLRKFDLMIPETFGERYNDAVLQYFFTDESGEARTTIPYNYFDHVGVIYIYKICE